jgi:hypothetical protein
MTLTIGIVCPKGAKTGGPEALHQLCDSLRSLGVDAWLVRSGKNLAPESEYSHYRAPWISDDMIQNLDYLVVPEIFPTLPPRLARVFSGKYVIWWLSVDNTSHFKGKNFEARNFPLQDIWTESNLSIWRVIKLLARKMLVKVQAVRNIFIRVQSIDASNALHICQSHYAYDFVEANFKPPSNTLFLVTDYVRIMSDRNLPKPNLIPQDYEHLIVYNPAKGGDLVQKVLSHIPPKILALPLRNMTAERLRTELSRASMYLDLGHFPGRDRLPREAASLNCPVMLAKRGAARNSHDFPIPDSDKFDLQISGPEAVAQRIQDFLDNHRASSGRQQEFQEFVSKDEERFHFEVRSWVQSLRKSAFQ